MIQRRSLGLWWWLNPFEWILICYLNSVLWFLGVYKLNILECIYIIELFLVFSVRMSTYNEDESKFMRKAKENPFVPVGEYMLCPHDYIIKRLKGPVHTECRVNESGFIFHTDRIFNCVHMEPGSEKFACTRTQRDPAGPSGTTRSVHCLPEKWTLCFSNGFSRETHKLRGLIGMTFHHEEKNPGKMLCF